MKAKGVGRGANFRKGAKDAIDPETARERAKVGGKIGGLAKVPKGFADVDVQARAQMSRKLNSEDTDVEEGTAQEAKT